MPRAQDPVERAARDRLHRLTVSRAPGASGAPWEPAWSGWASGDGPAQGAAVGWVPDAPTEIAADVAPDEEARDGGASDGGASGEDAALGAGDDGLPDENDIRDVVARLGAGALGAAATAYTAAHGHPLEHPHLDAGSGRRRWHLSVRLAVVAGVAIAVLGAGVAARATLAAPTVPVAAVPLAGSASVDARATDSAAPGQVSGASGDPDGGASGLPPASGAAAVVVHVVGQVVAPGVVQLPAGSRVSDAVAAAGGATPGADLAALNLARVVGDGEQIVVPAPGEVVGRANGEASVGGGKDPLVDLNTADLAALDALPGIGPVLAQRVLDWRDRHRRFSDVAELGEVAGIGDTLLGRLRELVRV